MRRSFFIAASYLIWLAVPAMAQHHGGAGHSGSMGGAQPHSARSFSGAGAGYRSSTFGGNFHITQGFGQRRHYPLRSGRGEFNHRGFNGRRAFYPYGAYYPLYGFYGDDPYFFSADDNRGENEEAYTGAGTGDYPAPYREDSATQRDFQALSSKIDRLQADVQSRNRPAAQEPATALVFRDQHVLEVRNYAISGGTLWVLGEQQAKKIPLAQLDLDATVRMNDDRGVDFQLPK
jgi:hypothetical protein